MKKTINNSDVNSKRIVMIFATLSGYQLNNYTLNIKLYNKPQINVVKSSILKLYYYY